nr:MFS transporter [Desulfobulbaceae bacterium]
MQTQSPNKIHYGWHIVWSGLLCIFACLGLGRFALGMLLPAMGENLNLTYSQMGLIGTVNFVGYLVSVLACGPVAKKFGYRKVIFTALMSIGLSMILIGKTKALWLILVLYCLTGMGSGAANVPMMALASAWFSPKKRGLGTGFMVIGSGFAILLSGKLIPFINQSGGAEGWRMSWQILGGITVLVSLICGLVLRNSPKSMGLLPFGQRESLDPTISKQKKPITMKAIAHIGAIYFLFGYTYVIYATFIVTSLIQDRGFSESTAGNFWSWVGLLSIASGPIFGGLSDKIGRKASLIIVFSIQATAYLLAALTLPTPFIYISIGCYGIVAWSIPSIMAALVADFAGPEKTAHVFGLITFIFALGQIAGPAIAGSLAEHSQSFSSSFFMAAIFALFAAVLSATLSPPPAN